RRLRRAAIPRRRRRVRGAPTLANDPATLTLGGASPDALLLAEAERVLEALVLDRALRAHRLRLLGVVVVLGLRVEDGGIESVAGGFRSPGLVHPVLLASTLKVRLVRIGFGCRTVGPPVDQPSIAAGVRPCPDRTFHTGTCRSMHPWALQLSC